MSRLAARPRTLPPGLDPRRPADGRRAHTPVHRLSVGVAILLSVVVLAVSTVGWVAFRYFNGSVTRVALDLGGDRPAERPGDLNVLLLGDDSRAGTNGQYGRVDGVRSDTTIVAHLGADGSVTLLSIPRDTLVEVPSGFRGTPRDGRDKLTNVITYAGVPGLVRTLENLTGLKINHFISIDLAGFKRMTDAVGGVTVCVAPLPGGSTRNLHDKDSGWSGRLGENNLNGDQALAFVRTRGALGDERLRIQRQQHFLGRLFAKTTSAGVLTNPVKVTQLLGAVGSSLKMDDGLSEKELIGLAQRMSGVATGNMKFVTLPTHVPSRAEGAVDDRGNIPPHGDVLVYEADKAEAILAPLRPAVAKPGDDSTGTTLSPGDVVVAEVRNATGRVGLASQTIADLRAAGFGGRLEATTATTGQAVTEIRYPPGTAASARSLAAAVPGARLTEASSASGGLVLVLGRSFTGVGGGAANGSNAGSAASAAGGPAAGATAAGPGPSTSNAAAPVTSAADASCVP